MRVGFLLHDLGPSGGVSVVLAHARGLQRAGADVDLVLTGTAPGREAPEGLRVRSLADAVEESYDWAIATWWETAAPMFELRARRRMAFLQSFEERFYTEDEPLERLAAGAVLQLPVDYVVIAGWMRRLLESVEQGRTA